MSALAVQRHHTCKVGHAGSPESRGIRLRWIVLMIVAAIALLLGAKIYFYELGGGIERHADRLSLPPSWVPLGERREGSYFCPDCQSPSITKVFQVPSGLRNSDEKVICSRLRLVVEEIYGPGDDAEDYTCDWTVPFGHGPFIRAQVIDSDDARESNSGNGKISIPDDARLAQIVFDSNR